MSDDDMCTCGHPRFEHRFDRECEMSSFLDGDCPCVQFEEA